MPDSLPFSVTLEKTLRGANAPSGAGFATCLADAGRALADLWRADLELFSNVSREDDIASASAAARDLAAGATDIFVLGIGGSSLGGQALANLLPFGKSRGPRLTFLDNIDPATLSEILAATDLKTARFVAISKSGGTAETLVQTLVFADALSRASLSHKDRFLVVTEEKPSALRKFGESIGCPILPHPLGIGGRYSVLCMVGILPALLMGLDAGALRAGARAVLAQARSGADAKDIPAVSGAALHMALVRERALRESVLWIYADKLKTLGPWWRQIWAESLGKNGQGTTPVAALGPVDQHSQLQLFLDGPGGALFTILTTGQSGKGPSVPNAAADALGVSYLGGHAAGDLPAAEARATAETLAKRGRLVREIHVPQIDERALGALFMQFMLETIVMGKLMGIDPFDQPAVEEGKILARAYLEGKSA
jgi:glucose-6-phosphate isomerase